MSVWVQSRSGNEEAFKVDFNDGMDFADLKEKITLKRNVLNLPAGAVQSIHSENSDEETHKIDPEDIVPKPEKGKIGASSKMPYFFSIAPTQADSIVRPSSPNFTPSVWILCILNPLEAVGTAWIASDRKVVTVFHNIAKDPQNSTSRAVLKANWAVVSKLERVQGHVCVPRGSVVVPVKLAKFSVPNDWAVMEREDQLTFPPSLVLKVCEVGEIPVDGSEAKLKVFHCPVSMFNEGHLDVCGCTSLESRLSLKTAHKMYVEVGMFRGSSGGIFAFTIPGGEHRVLGMHSEGRNTAQSIEDVQAEDPDLSALEAAAVASDSCANNHGSFSMGIIVAKYGPLLAAIRA